MTMDILYGLVWIALAQHTAYLFVTRWLFKLLSVQWKWASFWMHYFWVWVLPPVVGCCLLFVLGMRMFGVFLLGIRAYHWLVVRFLDTIKEDTGSTFNRFRQFIRWAELGLESMILLLILLKW
jgi:hypothetical protein